MATSVAQRQAYRPRRRTLPLPWFIWGSAMGFVLFQFFLQLSSGVMLKQWAQSFSIDALEAGVLGSSYYYIYASLQTPAGLLMDKFGPRHLLSIGALVCAVGCLAFAGTDHIYIAEVGRLMMGGGSAFAFVGSLYLIREWFAPNRYAFMVGIAETIGMAGTIIGSIFLSVLIKHVGWQECILAASAIAFALSGLCWMMVRNTNPENRRKRLTPCSFKEGLLIVLKTPLAWWNGLYIGLLFSVITVFVALWGIPFLQLASHMSLTMATAATTMVFLGAGIGSPFMGYLSSRLARRRPLLSINASISLVLVSLVIYWPHPPTIVMFILLFLLGFSCSSYVLSYAISDDIAPLRLKNTFTGFTNTLAVITAPLLQPLIGFLLEYFDPHGHIVGPVHYHIAAFREALTVMPISILLALILSFYIPETKNKPQIEQ